MLERMINKQIQACEGMAANVRELLPYADGPAYYQDKDTLAALEREATAWRQILRIVQAAQGPSA